MKSVCVLLCFIATMVTIFNVNAQSQAKDLNASLALIPGLAESPDKGAFVEVVKAMDEVYPGKIIISVYPYARSYNNAMTGASDFHIPAGHNPEIPDSTLPYRYASEKIGSLAMVLYSNNAKPITRQDVLNAMAKGGKFPYTIEVSAGAESNCPFPVTSSNDFESSLRKLNMQRIDALWNAQEETDLIIRKLKLKNINRSFWGMFDDVIVIQKSAKGDEINEILSGLLKKLRESGKLEKIYSKVHVPYDDWQPSKMAW
ncbi:MAG: hypothetical protein JW795_13675 [Chitinivibrionales bacterium]|nr:hypothetical protein [Chitinivibrionales bacterium]